MTGVVPGAVIPVVCAPGLVLYQTGNSPESARRNAELEGGAGRVELVTGTKASGS